LIEARKELISKVHEKDTIQVIVLDSGMDVNGNSTMTVKLLVPYTCSDGTLNTHDITVFAQRAMAAERKTRLVERRNRSRGLKTWAGSAEALVQMLSFCIFGLYDQLNYHEIH